MRRTRQERSIYMFYGICRNCVNMLNLGENAREAYDVLVTCTWGICKLYMWAGRKHVRKRFSEHRRSAGQHCSDILRGAHQCQNGAKMHLDDEEFWSHSGWQGAVWSVFESSKRRWTCTKRLGGDLWYVWWFGEHVFKGCFRY